MWKITTSVICSHLTVSIFLLFEYFLCFYNSKITISEIPLSAYNYVVNGKSAIEWVMERYQISTHKESGIVNDPNDWSKEQGNDRYILDLILSVINVSVQTDEIVKCLPKLKFE